MPLGKVKARYYRSLDLLREAIQYTNRAFFFDTSFDQIKAVPTYIAEITNGQTIDVKVNAMPNWFRTAVWDKF